MCKRCDTLKLELTRPPCQPSLKHAVDCPSSFTCALPKCRYCPRNTARVWLFDIPLVRPDKQLQHCRWSLRKSGIKIMAPFPYLPMLAIMASLVSQVVVQMSVYAYAAFMVEHLGVVNDSDKAGRSCSMQVRL